MKKQKGKIIVISLLMALASGYAIGQDADLADLKVSNSDALKAAIGKVQPNYPVVAKQLRLEGKVEIEAHVGTDGSVESAKSVSGNAVLATAAVSAAKQWKFTPFTVDGKPVKAVASLTFLFKI